MAVVPTLSKVYWGWDKNKPPSGLVICKSLSEKGFHTFHGLIGYSMKDVKQDHFYTIDYNIAIEDIVLGMEQLALHGPKECKPRILLTQCNFAKECMIWQRSLVNLRLYWIDNKFFGMLKLCGYLHFLDLG